MRSRFITALAAVGVAVYLFLNFGFPTGHEVGDPIAAVGSLIVLAGMIFFGWLVFRNERAPARQQIAMAPAE
jgi:hypothetical protein